MGSRIDALNPAVAATRHHVIPAMKDNVTVKMTVGQMLDLLLDGAPGALDTLNELAAALGDDANFAATVTNALAGKAETEVIAAALEAKLDILQPQVDVSSATTTDIGAVPSQNVRITGTTPIVSLGVAPSGTFRRVLFAGVLTLTYSAISFILPGAANITTAAGDFAEFVSDGSGNWRCVSYERASGQPVVMPIGVNQVWQDVSRAIATDYTNTTGRPIHVSVKVTAASTSSAGSATLTVAGVNVARATVTESNGGVWNPLTQTLAAIVPSGAVYAVTGTNASISSWSELR